MYSINSLLGIITDFRILFQIEDQLCLLQLLFFSSFTEIKLTYRTIQVYGAKHNDSTISLKLWVALGSGSGELELLIHLV